MANAPCLDCPPTPSPLDAKPRDPTPGPDLQTLRAAGLGYEDIARLIRLRRRVDAGEVGELTLEHKRLLFLKYLVASGRLGHAAPINSH